MAQLWLGSPSVKTWLHSLLRKRNLCHAAASSLIQEVIYIRKLLTNLGFPQVSATEVGEDNRTCIAWSEGSVGGSDRAKHIDLRAHFVPAAVQDKIVSLHNMRSNENVADILTKALPEAAFTILRKQLMGI